MTAEEKFLKIIDEFMKDRSQGIFGLENDYDLITAGYQGEIYVSEDFSDELLSFIKDNGLVLSKKRQNTIGEYMKLMKLMKLIILFLAVFLMACNKTDVQYVNVPTTVEVPQSLEGFWRCDNGGQVELLVDHAGRVSFDSSGQFLTSVNNYDNSLTTHLSITDVDLLVQNGDVILNPRNYTYTAAQNLLDNGGTLLTGSRRTDIRLQLVSSGNIKFTITVYSGAILVNNNTIVSKRTINCN
jgi:hypothetical protein